MNSPKVSVIVAVYNAEAYIDRCMKSLLEQTLTDFEILLIDDGSPDNSGKICDDYAASDSRIRVFHKPNGGVGSARKLGIEQACGEYTIHVDPDDWVENDMLEDLYKNAIENKADMVICDLYEDCGNSRKYMSQQPNALDTPSILHELHTHLFGGPVNKLVRLGCYREHGINYSDELRCGEDTLVLVQLLSQPIVVSYEPKAYYHYDIAINQSSSTNLFTPQRLNEQIKSIKAIEAITKPTDMDALIKGRYSYCAYVALKINAFSKQEYLQTFPRLEGINIFENKRFPFHERFILWVSTHLWYRGAVIMAQGVQKWQEIKKYGFRK